MPTSRDTPECNWEKVVVRLENEVIKGFVEKNMNDTLDALLGSVAAPPPPVIRIRRLDGCTFEDIRVENTKAVFYVKEFDGNPSQKDIHFYRGAPIFHGVWIRLEFNDGEVMEGLVQNTVHFLLHSGFFFRPTDPRSNNRLVYVSKSWLRDCRILGLRNI